MNVSDVTTALHKVDCIENGLGMHEAGDPDQYCTMLAPKLLAALAPTASAATPAPSPGSGSLRGQPEPVIGFTTDDEQARSANILTD